MLKQPGASPNTSSPVLVSNWMHLWVRKRDENACHLAIYFLDEGPHFFCAPRWSVSFDKVAKWCKAYLVYSITVLRYVFNQVLQCFVEGSLFICFLVPCFQWPFLYPPASKSCGPQVSDPFAQLQNRTGTVCTRRTRISWIQSHHLATKFKAYKTQSFRIVRQV